MLDSSIKRILLILIWWSLAVCLPLFFVAFNANFAFTNENIYMYSVDNFGVIEKTGIQRQELHESMRELIGYFNYSTEISSIYVDRNGHIEYLFSKPEQAHFEDVRSMLMVVRTVAWVSGLLLLFAIATFAVFTIKGKSTYSNSILRCFKLSTLTTLGIGGVVAVVSLLGGFDYLFYWFHVLSFSNDLWMGTESSRMIQLFPSDFFMHVLIMIAVATCLQMATTVVVSQSFSKFIYICKRRV